MNAAPLEVNNSLFKRKRGRPKKEIPIVKEKKPPIFSTRPLPIPLAAGFQIATEECKDEPVYENGKPTDFTMPVLPFTKLVTDHDRGMMSYDGDNDPVYAGYVASLPLEELKFALAREATPKANQFLAYIVDPNKARVPITSLAKLSGIGLPEMMQIWRSYKLVQALGVFINHAPAIAEHTAQDAMSYNACCPRCDGGGVMKVERYDKYEWLQCVQCQGTGIIRKMGDSKSRDQIFQATGILATRANVNVVTQIHQHHSAESIIDELDEAIDILPTPITEEA